MEDFESMMLLGNLGTPIECHHEFYGHKEDEHFTCLECDCPSNKSLNNATQDCPICLCGLIEQECVMLSCRHVMHTECVRNQLDGGFPGPAISFAFMSCVLCRTPIEHARLESSLRSHKLLFNKVKTLALKQLALEFEEEHEDIVKEGGKFYQKPEEFALHHYTFYNCHECNDPFFGGRRNCGEAVEEQDAKMRLCDSCTKANCHLHGKEYMAFKCRYCCKPSTWFCWGTHHFCEPCHDNAWTLKDTPSDQLPPCDAALCPLQGNHPPHGQEFCLGCAMCHDNAHEHGDEVAHEVIPPKEEVEVARQQQFVDNDEGDMFGGLFALVGGEEEEHLEVENNIADAVANNNHNHNYNEDKDDEWVRLGGLFDVEEEDIVADLFAELPGDLVDDEVFVEELQTTCPSAQEENGVQQEEQSLEENKQEELDNNNEKGMMGLELVLATNLKPQKSILNNLAATLECVAPASNADILPLLLRIVVCFIFLWESTFPVQTRLL